MQVHILLPKTIVLSVVIEIVSDGISPLAAAMALVNEVVDLAGYSLHTNLKGAHFPWHQKVQGVRLHGKGRNVHLLGWSKLRYIVKLDQQGVWGPSGEKPASV